MRIEPGRCWEFVRADGERTLYVVEHTEPLDVPGPRVRLRNLETGRIACVTWDWLLRDGQDGIAHWVATEQTAPAIADLGEERPEPLVIFHMGTQAVVGPAGAWRVGDPVEIPARGPKFGEPGLPGFDGEVTAIAVDGLAKVSARVSEELAA